ncbi:hypothetical protein J6S88_00920 [bacterium]|nr:hypothetical protein [bacterium]
MKKLLLIFSLLVLLFTTGCSEQAYIVFNKQPITRENILNASYLFAKGERVYYIVTIPPKKAITKKLLIQVYKRDNKEMRYGYKLVYGKNVFLNEDEQYYYTDYYVFADSGLYEFKAYSADNPTKELASNIVYVE